MGKETDLYEFMLEYQLEHAGETVPPTLQEMAEAVTRSKGMAHYYLQRLVEHGLVERRKCGSRKYVAVVKEPDERSQAHNGTE